MAKMMKKAADGYTSYGSKASKPSPVTDYAGKAGKQDSYTQYKKGGVIKKKAKDGSSFGMLSVKAGVDKNPKATFADKIAGAKGMAKKGKTVAKKMKNGGTLSAPKKDGVSMQLGTYTRQIGKNYTGKATKAVGLTKAKYGVSMMKKGGKCKNGC